MEGEGVGLWVYVAQQLYHLALLRLLAKPVHERDEVHSWDHLSRQKGDGARGEKLIKFFFDTSSFRHFVFWSFVGYFLILRIYLLNVGTLRTIIRLTAHLLSSARMHVIDRVEVQETKVEDYVIELDPVKDDRTHRDDQLGVEVFVACIIGCEAEDKQHDPIGQEEEHED